MTLTLQSSITRQAAPDEAPHWVNSFLPGSQVRTESAADVVLQVRQSEHFSLIRATIPGAGALDGSIFEQRVTGAYRAIARQCSATPTPHPVRFWNCIPDIHRIDDPGIERYMRFNAGRFEAFNEWFGQEAFARRAPAASAVGCGGNDLVIIALCATEEGSPIANPRQIAPYRYSRRYGPLPPCFARATVVRADDDHPLLLVGGTASIRGEETVHPQNFHQQVRETLANLAALISAAHEPGRVARWQYKGLEQFRELRVFLPRTAGGHDVLNGIHDAFPKVSRIEMVNADICRCDLLIEIEGLAELKS